MEKAIILCFPATVTQPVMSWKFMESDNKYGHKNGVLPPMGLYLWNSVELVLSNFRKGFIDGSSIICR